MDRNGDRVITRAEWRGSAQAFRENDWNGDGRLSGEEVLPGARRPRGVEPTDDAADADFREFDDWTVEGFTYLDRNRDGRLTRAEWYFDAASWTRADKNRDNVLSRAEFLSEDGPDTDPDNQFESLDANNNGRIERREWRGAADTFAWLDVNNDGTLTRIEMGESGVNNERRPRRADAFASLDVNRDNRISEEEWQGSRRSFLQQDVNRDGAITRGEFSDPNATVVTPLPGVVGTTGIGRPIVVVVSARAGWVDTGIDVRPGDVLTIRSEGTVRLSSNVNDSAGPGGANRRADQSPMPNHPAGSLVARVATDPPMFIGDGRAISRVATTGRLYLGVNDDHSADNSGEFRATVTVRR